MDDDLKQIDEQLVALAHVRYRYDIINPVNTQEEYRSFIALNGKYNPQFTYNKTEDFSKEIKALQTLAINTNTTLGAIFAQIRDDLLEEAQALQQVGTDHFLVHHAYGALRDEEIKSIHKLLAIPLQENELNQEEEKEETFPTSVLGKRVQKKLEDYNLKDWTIIYSPHALSRTAITKDTKTITIKEDELFSEQDIQKLLVHEIETHVLRWQNGMTQPYKIFSVGTHQYLTTEEGLAWYNEHTQGVAHEQALRGFAILALATYLGKTKGFADIYHNIRPYLDDDEKTFRIVTRVKRGLSDTSKPGGYLKDHTYYQGAQQLQTFVKEGGDVRLLYAGKISISDLALLKQGVLNMPKHLPEFLL